MGQRYILTGAPGSGKTSILTALRRRGYDVVAEAATDVIAALGSNEPWRRPDFIDKIVTVQRQRQMQADPDGGFATIFDRSPVCTLALAAYIGRPVSAYLAEELERIDRERTYERRVFFVHNIGFVERTLARRIRFAEALAFERIHAETYVALGYQLVDVPPAAIEDRADLIETYLRTSRR